MGSGRGVSRRTRAVVAKEAVADVAAWTKFWQGAGVGELSLLDYYGGNNNPSDDDEYQQQTQEYENALGELLSDAVNVGAITLSRGCKADDFVFELKRWRRSEITPGTLLPGGHSTSAAWRNSPFFFFSLLNKKTNKAYDGVELVDPPKKMKSAAKILEEIQEWVSATA